MKARRRAEIIREVLELAEENEELELEEMIIEMMSVDRPQVLVLMPRPLLEQ